MGYYDVSAVWNGAVDEETTLTDDKQLEEWADKLKRAAAWEATNGAEGADESRVELFVVYHDHSPELEDCSCVQYLTDHHAAVTMIGGVEVDPRDV